MDIAIKNEQIAKAWFNAFNEHELQKLLALYSDDAEHYSPKLLLQIPHTGGKIKGKAALQNWWAAAFERLPQLHYQLTVLTANEHRVFMEYIRQVPNEPNMLVAEVLEITDGYITASRVYHG